MKNCIAMLYACLISAAGFGQLNLQWQNIGPDNLGGTITALIIDNRDTTGQTLYAGAMGGGIWKSTNGAASWGYLGCMGNYAINCMTQSNDGIIYIGTGFQKYYAPGLIPYNEHLGNGIYYLDSADNFAHLDSTTVTNPASNWSSVYGIAVNPVNSSQIIATTSNSIFKSLNKGNTWSEVTIAGAMPANGVGDVKWSSNGLNIYISLSYGVMVRSTDGGNTWSILRNSSNPGYPNASGYNTRIVLKDAWPDMAFVSVARGTNFWGIIKTTNAGNTWDTVALASPSFAPFGTSQGYYNAFAVSPADTDHFYVGGDFLYSYSPQTGPVKLPQFTYPGLSITNPAIDEFNMVINNRNPNEMYIASAQGVFKTTQAFTDFTTAQFNPVDNGLVARDFFSLAVSKSGRPMGCSDDMQSLLVGSAGGADFSPVPTELGYCAFSYIDTTFAYTVAQNGGAYINNVGISIDGLATFGFSTDSNIGGPLGYNCPTGAGNPYLLLHETKTAFNTIDSVAFVASLNLQAGSQVIVASNNAHATFQYTLPVSLSAGDTLVVPDALQSQLFFVTPCGIWVKRHALLFKSPDWFYISDTVPQCMAASQDGNILYAGTAAGTVMKISGLNFGHYISYNMADSFTVTRHVVFADRPINGIAVDPGNESTLMVTLGGYNYPNQPNVYKSTDAGNTWEGYTLGSNSLSAYTCIIDQNNSSHYIVGTEHGIFTSADSGATWQPDNGDMCDIPVYQLKQTPLFTDECPVLYAATSARGIWRSYTLTPQGCNISLSLEPYAVNYGFDIRLYPNPATSVTNVEFTLAAPQQVSLQLFDITGRLIQTIQQFLLQGEQKIEINTVGLQPGTYLINVRNGVTATTRLLVIGE